MKIRYSLLLVSLFNILNASAQDTVKYRMIFIGDAGEMDKQQGQVLNHATAKILPAKAW